QTLTPADDTTILGDHPASRGRRFSRPVTPSDNTQPDAVGTHCKTALCSTNGSPASTGAAYRGRFGAVRPYVAGMTAVPDQSTDPARRDTRLAWLSIVGFWSFYFLINSVRAFIMEE